MKRLLAVGVSLIALEGIAGADPCGMVPPVYTGNVPPITRVGPQRTYVFYRDGVETYVIRPGFSGNVAEFGMLIPFPSVPALRKVPDELFAQIGAAIDPPEVLVDLSPQIYEREMMMGGAMAPSAAAEDKLAYNQVAVLKQEAVGMYEVAVLAAGSSDALKRWMDEHGFQYPKGMDAVVDEYVKLRWVFVAEKTRVGSKSESDPKPGMRKVDASLPAGSTFDGYVQAMGFRFKVDKPVVPMRLSPFNPGEKRQILYYLTDKPVKLDGVPETLVKRQLSGKKLHANVTGLLPLRVVGGTLDAAGIKNYRAQRDPAPHNGMAKDLFASDLLARHTKTLSLPHEEEEKELLRIGEALDMRGPEIDTLHEAELATERSKDAKKSIDELDTMTVTVLDGEIPEQWMKEHDLTISRYEMSGAKNTRTVWNVRTDGGPSYERTDGVLIEGETPAADKDWYKNLWK